MIAEISDVEFDRAFDALMEKLMTDTTQTPAPADAIDAPTHAAQPLTDILQAAKAEAKMLGDEILGDVESVLHHIEHALAAIYRGAKGLSQGTPDAAQSEG